MAAAAGGGAEAIAKCRPRLCPACHTKANCDADNAAASCKINNFSPSTILFATNYSQINTIIFLFNLSLPSTMQDANGPGHDVARQKKSSNPKREKLHFLFYFFFQIKN